MCSIANGYKIYNDESSVYDVDTCHNDTSLAPMSAQCANFFTSQACFYECDVNLGKYRCALGPAKIRKARWYSIGCLRGTYHRDRQCIFL